MVGDCEMEEDGSWEFLKVFANSVRIEIIRLLLQFEIMTLSDVRDKLASLCGRDITLPGVLKHLKLLENRGIVRRERGWVLEEPDARTTVYFPEGRERIRQMLRQLEDALGCLQAGIAFRETAKLARKVQRRAPAISREDKRRLETLLSRCESEDVVRCLTEDELKKVKFWKMMMPLLDC